MKAVQVGTLGSAACALLRYLPDGKPDTSFGDAGVATYPVTPCGPGQLAIMPDGRILVGDTKFLRVWN